MAAKPVRNLSSGGSANACSKVHGDSRGSKIERPSSSESPFMLDETGGGEEGSHVWRDDSVRRDKVMMSPHDVDIYAGKNKLSTDAKEDDSAHQEQRSRRSPQSNIYFAIVRCRVAIN